MSDSALAYVATLEPLLSASEYKVARALARLAQHPDHLIEAPVREIAALAQVSKRTCQLMLDRLRLRQLDTQDGPLLFTTPQHADDGAQLISLYCFPALGVPKAMQFSAHWQRNKARFERIAQQHQYQERLYQAHRRGPRDSSASSG